MIQSPTQNEILAVFSLDRIQDADDVIVQHLQKFFVTMPDSETGVVVGARHWH